MQQNVYFGNGWWESGDKFMPGEKQLLEYTESEKTWPRGQNGINYNNFWKTERGGRAGEYWPEVVQYGPSASRSSQKRPRANIPQYGLSKRV